MINWEDRYRSICRSKKLYLAKPEWIEKPSRSDYRIFTSQVMDESGIVIPGIRIQGSSHVASYTGFRTYSYILQLLHDGDWLRAFAIDVCPDHAKSHRCHKTGQQHFGSHLHYGDHRSPWFTWRPISYGQQTPNDGRFYRRFMRHIHLIQIDGLLLEPFGVDNGMQTNLFAEPLA